MSVAAVYGGWARSQTRLANRPAKFSPNEVRLASPDG